MSKYIDADKITPIMAEYVADVFSRKEHLDNISYGYCMEIADVFRQYAERAKQEQSELDVNALREWSMRFAPDIRDAIEATAYHFWNEALNVRKEDE